MDIRTNADGSRRAVFSDCGRYRYQLRIVWDAALPLMVNIGLNPSTADEMKNDPTVTRDIKRAQLAGFGSLLKLNLFAYRTPSPAEMKHAKDPFGEQRPCSLLRTCEFEDAKMIVCAWGNHGDWLSASDDLRHNAESSGMQLHCYRITKQGEPAHPLYLPLACVPVPYIF